MANYTGGSPANSTEVTALAEQMATDYAAQFARIYDFRFAGLKDWDHSGYDDYWEFDLDTHSTRVCTVPYNFCTDTYWQQFDLNTYGEFIYGKADSGISASSTGTVSVWETTDTTDNITASNKFTTAVATGVFIFLHWHCGEDVWYVIAEDCT